MKKNLFLVLMFSGYILSGFSQTQSQTRTATYLNNLNQFRDVFGDQNYPKATASQVASNDNIYATTNKLTVNSYSTLALQGFGFTIPATATINNISIRLRRFKKGKASIGDGVLCLMQRFQALSGMPSMYGVFWANGENYAGSIYPDTETEYVFSQTGTGNNGGLYNDQSYQWTPEMINQVTFGVRISTSPLIGSGTVVVYYDQVEVTVEYTLPSP